MESCLPFELKSQLELWKISAFQTFLPKPWSTSQCCCLGVTLNHLPHARAFSSGMKSLIQLLPKQSNWLKNAVEVSPRTHSKTCRPHGWEWYILEYVPSKVEHCKIQTSWSHPKTHVDTSTKHVPQVVGQEGSWAQPMFDLQAWCWEEYVVALLRKHLWCPKLPSPDHCMKLLLQHHSNHRIVEAKVKEAGSKHECLKLVSK